MREFGAEKKKPGRLAARTKLDLRGNKYALLEISLHTTHEAMSPYCSSFSFLFSWPHSRNWGYGPSGVLELLLVIVLVMALAERAGGHSIVVVPNAL
jgi:hypothetical protein